nr:class I SAM-dependent methyltransferase [Oceanisphaera litoralis]
MLDLARVTAQDVLYDLGSGDGRIVVAAAMGREARAVGVDMDPPRQEEAREFAATMGMDHLVEFIEGDFFTVDISRATVVTLYLLQSVNLLLRPRLLTELKPGTRVISHSFDMGDWLPDDRCYAAGAHIYKWIVPANVAGVWQWQAGERQHFSVALTQHFQQLSAKAWLNEVPVAVEAATLRGNRLTLTLQVEGAEKAQTFNWRLKNSQLQPSANEAGFTRAIRL